MNYYIITGASRGLGEAIAENLISKDNHLFCISRKGNEDLVVRAGLKDCRIDFFEYDFNFLEEIDMLAETIFERINFKKADSVCLINNAGVAKPIKPVGNFPSFEIISNMNVNLIAPMILVSEFIKRTEEVTCERKIVNISSGAGKKPYYGWGCYCSAKAAMDMFTGCVGVEQKNITNPVKIISFVPGIIDTDMQADIRECSEEDFEQVERFIKFKENGNLKSPDFVAKKLLELIHNNETKTGMIYDIKEL
ncbi:(S)-benzoin forming benzil reductase [Acetivibrio cellulolyticus]|uniref:(S)-benzoin forming benzil reductase n=1 Tax=Acetivibrio cellulolyticus TaxID=35830 RepID=UPI0001E2EB5C|nr:(S)-benzoin forming benzil reductase [Acetivibrio cellulolyticus]